MEPQYSEENGHQLRRVQRQYASFWTGFEVVAEETARIRPAPLLPEQEGIERVVHINQKTTRKTTCRGLNGTCRRVGNPTQGNRSRKMATRHHARIIAFGQPILIKAANYANCANSSW